MNGVFHRARGALFGLAIGDALSWPAMFHRSHLLPFWTRRLRREIDAASEESHAIRPPMPFSLNRPVESFALGPTDDTEWASFTANLLLKNEGLLTLETITDAWMGLLAGSDTPIRGSISVQAALTNLKRGWRPPVCGHDNPHYFDDSACARAVAIGTFFAGRPDRAAEMASLEASVTNALDGLWAAMAMARAVSAACAGCSVVETVSAALEALPRDSWVRRKVDKALKISEGADLLGVLPLLVDGIVNREYSYGTAAPETLALTLSLFSLAGGNFSRGVFAATAIPKTADSVPAMVGALCGASNPEGLVSPDWEKSLRFLRGICLPQMAGVDFIALAEQVAERAAEATEDVCTQ